MKTCSSSHEGRRVLIIVENLPVPHDKRVWQEAQSLTAAGYRVAVICPKGHGLTTSHEVIDGVEIFRHSLPFEARRGVEYIFEYSWALVCEFLLTWKVWWRHGFDVIHACNPPDTIFLIARLFRVLFGTRFVFDHHDGNLELWIAKGGRQGAVYKALAFLERQTFRSADVSLAVNDHYCELARNRGGMAADRVFLVRNGPSRALVDRISERMATPSTDGESRIVVGYLGVMGKQDSVDNLIRIAADIVQQRGRDDVMFRIMGAGPELESLKQMVCDLGIEASVSFTGWVGGDDYIKNISSCDICVNADEVNDYNRNCSPNKIYEYMIFAKPIVQFDMPESRIVAGNGALYAAPNDNADFAARILELVDNSDLREEIGQRGRKRFLAKFTWDNSERGLLAAYERVFEDS